MAAQSRFLADWVKGAYGMELGLAPMLEQQTGKLDGDTELHKSLSHHLEKTRRHASLLRQRLEQMGEDVSVIRPIDPVTVSLGRVDGGKPDPARQTELLDYVTETFEVASYRALRALAEMMGDVDTSRVCEAILADELAISSALQGRLPGRNGYMDTGTSAVQGNVMLAHELFAALNAHDLDRYEKLLADHYRAEMPGDDAGPVSREENRTRLETFLKAIPDLRYELNRVSASGDTVFVEWDASGKNSGPFPTMEGGTIPPTNKRIRLSGVTILRFENGMLAHSRVIFDRAGVMRQLGVMPGGRPRAERAVAPAAGRDIVYVEIPAKDRETAASFYNAMFGWEYEHLAEPMPYTTFQAGTVEGGFPDINEMNPEGQVLFYIHSDDIDADLQRAERFGGKTVVRRTEIPGVGWFGVISDPSGNRVALFNRTHPRGRHD